MERTRPLRGTVGYALIALCASAEVIAANDVLHPDQALYVNWHSSVIASAQSLSGQDRANAVRIASRPTATWLTSGTPAEVEARAAKLVADAQAEGKVAVIVA